MCGHIRVDANDLAMQHRIVPRKSFTPSASRMPSAASTITAPNGSAVRRATAIASRIARSCASRPSHRRWGLPPPGPSRITRPPRPSVAPRHPSHVGVAGRVSALGYLRLSGTSRSRHGNGRPPYPPRRQATAERCQACYRCACGVASGRLMKAPRRDPLRNLRRYPSVMLMPMEDLMSKAQETHDATAGRQPAQATGKALQVMRTAWKTRDRPTPLRPHQKPREQRKEKQRGETIRVNQNSE